MKSFEIIDYIADHANSGVTDISNALGIPKSTVHNILETLNHFSILEKSRETARYHLGVKLIELGYRAQTDIDICRIAHPYLRGLNEELDETAHLTVLDRDEVLYVDCIESKKRLRTYSVIGVRAPLYCTSVGKAILAYVGEPEVERIIKTYPRKKITEHTITEPHELKEELRNIRLRGYAVDNMEHEDHLRCIGAPIFNSRNEVFASISISGPTSRVLPESVEVIAPRVTYAAKEISRKIGYRG